MHLFRRIIVFLMACLTPALALAADPLPRSILVLDQSDVRGPFYYEIFSGLRTTVNASTGAPVTIYAESLDLSRFTGPIYEESLRQHFRAKYLDKPIGVVVAIGSASLEYVLRWRSALWSDVPVVFAMVDEPTVARLNPPRDVTGSIMKLRLADMMTSARAVVPDLKRIAFVGDAWDSQTAYRHWKDEIPVAAVGVEVIDLTGLTMQELRTRVATLPEHAAILYSAIYSDGGGKFYPPADALALVAETANRPIVIAAETFLGRGGIGGFVMIPSLIGDSAARLAMRILDGESAASIPAAAGNIVRPIFDWRQMQRWGVSASSLPPDSEIRFRDPTAWEQYRWQIVTIAVVLLLQAALIIGLLYEHRRRQKAEIEARQRMFELAHMNRHATAGELSASIAHELNQPLGAILNNTETAAVILNSPSPNLEEIKAIVNEIKRDDERASEVILRLRRLLNKTAFEAQDIDLNDTVREVFALLSVQAAARNVTLNSKLLPQVLRVSGDRIQLQQVILNLVVNGIESMVGATNGQREIISRTALLDDSSAEVSITDFGPGIPLGKVRQVFEPFFTTKEQGMGMGLSIARTIVEAHGGRIWAENQSGGGAIFRVSLPLAKTH
jgi:signal transduction histidine kinase